MKDQTQANKEKESLINQATVVLKEKKSSSGEILELAVKLHQHDEFSWARKILDLAVSNGIEDNDLKRKIEQKRALSTYKDTGLNREKALDQAIEILDQAFDLAKTKDQETLGLAGAIYKRKWEIDGIKAHLELSLIYYDRGYKQGIEGDDGYTAINAAYILDLLAYLEQKQAAKLGMSSSAVTKRRKDAVKIREEIIGYLSEHLKEPENVQEGKSDRWPLLTMAEACFGMKQYTEAEKWLKRVKDIPELPEWEYVTMARQLVHLAKLQAGPEINDEDLEKTEAWKVLYAYLGDNAAALRSMYRGKLGLALSGGGFRASFYHIGVLAKLAELDLLRHVEVLSCVSGGSILGAHYYLELRRLINFEKKKDGEIGRDDYIHLVNNLVDDFLAGVQDNPRVKLLSNPWDNLKMIFAPGYSRTQRLGELYEEMIYSRVKDGEGKESRWLNGLYLNPIEKQNFLPRRDNWSRQCKIPELVLNATTLNTGHNWQFTASWMGESPSQIDPDVDTNDRYRRTYYNDAPDPHKKVRLGSAVGASSCVPGLFEPIIMQGLYEDATVRLVDGGVYDNQGVAGLIEQDCNVIISSDATGQMNTDKDPGGGILKPLLRTNSTLMQRVRDSQYQDLKARARAGILKGFAYVHLKQGVEGENVDWVGSDEPEQPKTDPDAKTEYGIRRDIQELIAGIRTDLDSFSDLEAYALMTSGYCAIEGPVQQYLTEFPLQRGDQPKWKFLAVEPVMKQDQAGGEDYDRLKKNLEAASKTFGKVWKLDRTLNLIAKAAAGSLVLGLIYLWYSDPGMQPFDFILSWLGSNLTIGAIMVMIAVFILVFFATALLGKKQGRAIKDIINYRDIPRRVIVGTAIGLVGWIGAAIHLRWFDRMFKSIGRVE